MESRQATEPRGDIIKTNITTIMKYQAISPDGFAINCDGAIYTNRKKALEALKDWTNNYKAQGYYSQTCYNGYIRRISLAELLDYCEIRTICNQKKQARQVS